MGYWEPHTSSIDFCESNYLLTNYIVEPHNVWSSFVGVAAFGLLGLYYHDYNNNNNNSNSNDNKNNNNLYHEWRFTLSYVVLVIVGLGSMALHGTMHWIFQSSDELPMIYSVLLLLYECAEVDAPLGKAAYPWLPYALTALALINTFVYYAFQSLYWVFLLTFSTGTVVVIIWVTYLVYRPRVHKNMVENGSVQTAIYVSKIASLSWVGFGTPVWVCDMLLCEQYVLPVSDGLFQGYFKGFTPHVFWHFAAGFGCYCGVITLLLCRLQSLNIPHQTNWLLFGIIPVVSVGKSSNADNHKEDINGTELKKKLT